MQINAIFSWIVLFIKFIHLNWKSELEEKIAKQIFPGVLISFVLKPLDWCITCLYIYHCKTGANSVDDIRGLIAQHRKPKTSLRRMKNNTPCTMYRYKGNTLWSANHTPFSFKECDLPDTTILKNHQHWQWLNPYAGIDFLSSHWKGKNIYNGHRPITSI